MGYKLILKAKEYRALTIIAQRYLGAEILLRGMEPGPCVNEETGGGIYHIPEHVLWDAIEAVREDSGDEFTLPLAGKSLAQKWEDLVYQVA